MVDPNNARRDRSRLIAVRVGSLVLAGVGIVLTQISDDLRAPGLILAVLGIIFGGAAAATLRPQRRQ